MRPIVAVGQESFTGFPSLENYREGAAYLRDLLKDLGLLVECL